MAHDKSKKSKKTDDAFIKDMMDQFEDSEEHSSENRTAYEEDTKFSRGADQWPAAVLKQRIQEARPALVINKLPALIRSVVNESKQNKPAIVVSPVDNGADPDTAEIITGLVRSVERNSNAAVAYGTAIDHAVTGSFGFFRIDIDYAHPESFDLEARIRRIPNALSVHWDTSTSGFDATDWDYAFISNMYKKNAYEEEFPGASLIAFDGANQADVAAHWLDEDAIRVAEYFKRTKHKRKIIRFSVENPETGQTDVQTVRWDQLPGLAAAFYEGQGIEVPNKDEDGLAEAFIQASGIQITDEREAEYYKVKWYIVNGVEILKEEDWPGKSIPICPVWGDEHYEDGRRVLKSLIRDAKDPQAMLNFWRSATTELVALAPKAPWVGPKGFIPKGDEEKWASANTRSHAYLEYDPAAMAAPQRQAFAGVPAGAMQEAISSSEDMQSITGIYPSAIGARSNETSGRAILARERQGDVSNFHFLDNLNRAIQYAGSVLVDIIPSVYSARETIRILGEDSTEKVITLTQEAGGAKEPGMTGSTKLYNLSVGRYDVTVKTGPSFSTQREETRETLIELMRAVPGAAGVVGDQLMEHMDFVGADKVAKRLRSMLPDQIKAMEDEKITEAENPEAAALQAQLEQGKKAMQQMQQQGQALAQELEQLKKSKAADAEGKQLDNKTKQLELQVRMEEAKAKMVELQPTENKLEETQRQWDYDQQMQNDKQEHEAIQADADREMKQTDADNALQMQNDKQEHEAIQSDANRKIDLAKAIFNKSAAGNGELAMEDAVDQATMIVADGLSGDEAKYQHELMEQEKTAAMSNLVERLSDVIESNAKSAAPKRVVRDGNNMIVGLETIVEELN